MDNNSFKEQLSAVSVSKEKAFENQMSKEKQRAIDDAKYDYKYLKEEILEYAKKNGYSICDGKKTITYLYSPKTHTRYDKDNGVRYEKGLFGGLKIVQTNIISVRPFPEDNWYTYFNELVYLGKQDDIEIEAVVYNTISKRVLCKYPARVQCKTGDFVCIEIKLQCRIEF